MEVDVIATMIGGLMPYALVAFLGAIFALLLGVLTITGRRNHPGVLVAGLGLVALGGAVTSWWALPSNPSVAGSVDAMKLACVIRFSAWFGVSVVGLLTLALFAVAGARGQPRDVRSAAVVGGLGLLVAAVSAVGGVAVSEVGAGQFFYLRAFEYAALSVPLAAASLAGGAKDGPGRDAAAAAAVGFALVVAVSEVANRAMTWFILLMSVGGLPAADRSKNIVAYLEGVQAPEGWVAGTNGEIPWLVATMVAGCLVAVVGVGLAARDDNRSAWGALGWLVVVPLLWVAGSPTMAAVQAAAATLP